MSLLSCPLCLKPHFHGVDALRTSLISVATTHIACPVCNELLLGLDKFTIHLFSHIPSSNKTAQEDKSVIENSSQTNDNHIIKESCIEENVHDVEMIDKSEKNSDNVKADTEKNCISCDICNFHFSDETILELHQKLLHQTSPDKNTGKYNYHCHLCSKQFKMRGSLMVHLRVAHFGFIHNNHKNSHNYHIDHINCSNFNNINRQLNVEPSPTIMNENKSFPTNEKQAIISPQRSLSQVVPEKRKILNVPCKNQDNKQWECEVCLKLFTTKYFLKKHKRLHTGEMPYYCPQCNKYFTFQQSYHKHMLYHSDDKPHVCSECGRAFKELSTLHNHERIHSGERPFSCETCGKCFRQRVSYLVHRRIHTGVMPYRCTACNKSFRYKVSQRSHKCSVNPPGCVVRTPDLVEKLIQNQKDTNVQNHSLQKISESMSIIDAEFRSFDDNLKIVKHTLNEDVKQGISINTARRDLHFLEENLLDDQNRSISHLVQNYMVDNKLLKSTANGSIEHINEAICSSSSDNNKHELLQVKDDNAVSYSVNDTNNPDFFALMLSPVLSDVQSLCLSNYSNSQDTSKTDNTGKGENCVLQTINEESFKELLYGSTNN